MDSLNDTHLDSLLQVSTETDTLGFDLRAGQTWIYPTNYPVREYQYDIVQAALHENTLVSLPTGLGKTFIAAVVMYNFYRWYPSGKIIFMAPTKPLVRQQIDACYNIMAIPPDVTAEMTGAKITASRVGIWRDKRVFFITPHILQNDLETIPDLGPKIRCIVVDEAHKALGKQANCEVIRKLKEVNTNFRVLALSATPGSNFKNVTDVIANLLISHIECRTDESPDVAPYVFSRKLETIVVPLGGMLQHIKDGYIKILDTYTRPLINFQVLSGNCASLTKGKILLTMRDYKENCRNRNNYKQIMCNFTICITLYHGYELLIRHGLRSFLTFFEGSIDKPLINSINDLHAILEEVRQYLGPSPSVDLLPDGTIPEIPPETVFGHPKFYKLGDTLCAHFKEASDDNSTRAMVFCEYRESVNEAYVQLLKHRPLIRPKIFIGKGTASGAGQTQAQQLLAIKMFREGECNTLIATCIGEEGIDVGEVDLIVCFDISTKSPVRMVQRMGRTGRKRNGRVIILVTEGKEQQTLQDCLAQKSSMNNLLNSKRISDHFYDKNPKMVPDGLKQTCMKMFITIPKKNEAKKNKNGANTIKNMFENFSSSQSSSRTADSEDVSEVYVVPEFNRIPNRFELWLQSNKENIVSSEEKLLNNIFLKRLEKQTQQTACEIGHSSTTNAFVYLMKFADKKKYNLPTTQSRSTFLQKTNSETIPESQTAYFRQVDIRNMFKPKSCPLPDNLDNFDEEIKQPLLSSLINAINQFTFYNGQKDTCEICSNLFKCTDFHNNSREVEETPKLYPKNLLIPDYSIANNINENDLISFTNSIKQSVTNECCNDLDDLKIDNSTDKNAFNDTLQFYNLSNMEDIFEDEEIDDSNNKNVLRTPTKDTIVECADVSPILCRSNKIKALKSKLTQRLTQNNSTPNVNKNDCQRSFNFNEFESFFEEENNIENDVKIENSPKRQQEQNSQIKLSPSCRISPNSPDIFSQSFEDLKNIESMFDIADDNVFKSSSENDVNTNPNVENINNECLFDIVDESLFESSDDSNNAINNCKTNNDDEIIELEKNTEQIKTKNCSVEKEAQIKNVNDCFDPDATILIPSNEEYMLSPKLSQRKMNLSKLNKTSFNKTNSSLLSVTQLINFIDEDELESSLKENENIFKNAKITDCKKDFLNISRNKSAAILNNTKNNTSSDTSKNFSNFSDDDLSDFDLSFSNNKKFANKNIDTKKIDSRKNNKKINNKQTMNKILEKSIDNISNVKKPDSMTFIDLTNNVENIIEIDSDDEDSLLKFSYVSPVKISTQNRVKFLQKTPIKSRHNKRPIELIESDDDFEIRPSKTQKTSERFPKPTCTSKAAIPSQLEKESLQKCKKVQNPFIEIEAEIEDDDDYISDSADDNESTDADALESSFIHDTQLSQADGLDIQAKYLQSVRSPKINRQGFKIPQRPMMRNTNVFSQFDNVDEENTYVQDSFCVDNESSLKWSDNMSYLERAEAEIEKQRKRKRKGKLWKKRKRIIELSDDSD